MRAIIIFLLLFVIICVASDITRIQAIICEDMDEFDAIENKIHTGVVNAGGIEDRWAYPIIHPIDGRIALVIETRIEKYLTKDELDRVIELPDDWFPVIEE